MEETYFVTKLMRRVIFPRKSSLSVNSTYYVSNLYVILNVVVIKLKYPYTVMGGLNWRKSTGLHLLGHAQIMT